MRDSVFAKISKEHFGAGKHVPANFNRSPCATSRGRARRCWNADLYLRVILVQRLPPIHVLGWTYSKRIELALRHVGG